MKFILVGHWSVDGAMAHGSCHFDNGEVATNVMSVDAARDGSISTDLLDVLIRHFSYQEEWVFGMNIPPGETFN
jgi:hypothetical protein